MLKQLAIALALLLPAAAGAAYPDKPEIGRAHV